MKFCSSCGHELGIGRFCTNCGQPVDRSQQRTSPPIPAAPRPPEAAGGDAGPDTQERRAARREAALSPGPARTPPSADVPPPARFPLFADETAGEPVTRTDLAAPPAAPRDLADTDSGLLGRFHGDRDDRDDRDDGGRSADEALAALRSAAAGAPADDDRWDSRYDEPRRRRRRWPWLVALLVLAAALAGGALVWSRVADDTTAQDTVAAGSTARDLVAEATAEVPGRARPSREVGGAEVTYVAANLLDGDPSTAWRVAGNAAGERIVLTFPNRVTVSEVGLVNGYAKEATNAAGRTFDWYHGHRAITRVVWVFDDGTEVRQDLVRDREPQVIAVDDLTTRTVTLRIVDVSAPGTGRAARDFTAISDLTVLGQEG